MPTRDGRRSYPDELQVRARNLRSGHVGITEIAALLGVSTSAVHEWVGGDGQVSEYIKQCEWCDETFVAERVNARFCSSNHYFKARRRGRAPRRTRRYPDKQD